MENENNNKKIMPLPGDRQGEPGAFAGLDSMRSEGGRTLRRRVPATQQATVPEELVEEEERTLTSDVNQAASSSSQSRRTGEVGTRRNRIKWTRDMNIDVIKCYYRANRCEELPLPGYRTLFYNIYTQQHPTQTLTEQNLVDRRRAIIQKGYLTAAELENIKREIGNELYQTEITVGNSETVTNNQTDDTDTILNEIYVNTSFQINPLKDKLISLIEYYKYIEPSNRPSLPILTNIRRAMPLIQKVNEALAE
jgi:hypothetical protein